MRDTDELYRKLQLAWQAAAQANAEARPTPTSRDETAEELVDRLLSEPEPSEPSPTAQRAERTYQRYCDLLQQWEEQQEKEDCSRCGGTGYLSQYSHVAQGKCFSCGGSGVENPHAVYQEPPTPTSPAEALDSIHT
jgi:uncharacterized paraquat-inducible protein A